MAELMTVYEPGDSVVTISSTGHATIWTVDPRGEWVRSVFTTPDPPDSMTPGIRPKKFN